MLQQFTASHVAQNSCTLLKSNYRVFWDFCGTCLSCGTVAHEAAVGEGRMHLVNLIFQASATFNLHICISLYIYKEKCN